MPEPNRLINEKSPYLLQHAHNPVAWHPWGEEAFEQAKREDKPVFLSIGYSTCHWCHVMAHESFEDEAVAALLNRDYVAIKVDREERPDIDHIYMEVCQGITGRGGWPLTIFMTPDKKPFFAATYLPKNNRSGLKGLMQLLPEIAALWKERRHDVRESGEKITAWLQRQSKHNDHEELSDQVVDQAVEYYKRSFDPVYGGWGHAPKFPSPHNLMLLLRYYHSDRDEKVLEMVEKTLDAMYRGGIYDHIGFGFARYSTDRYWLVPHFEKMLYDNALLAIAYLEAFQVTGKEMYGRVAREIFTYVLRDMTSPEGGFYSAQDADSEGEEGKYYLWKPEEVCEVVGEEQGEIFCETYGVKAGGNFSGRSIPNLLQVIINEDERQRLEESRQKLFEYRSRRVPPHKDDKILPAWNGLMIAAMAFGARVLKEEQLMQAAQRAADFIWTGMRRKDGRLLARYREGQSSNPAYALDYVCMIWGLIELYQSGFQSRHLDQALALNRDLMEYFWDDQESGLFLYGHDAEAMLTRPKESYDGAIPSSNAIAALNLLRLSRLTGDVGMEEKAASSLNYFAPEISLQPTAHSFFLIAAWYYFDSGKEIVIVGEKGRIDTNRMLDVLKQHFLPDSVVFLKDRDEYADKIEHFPWMQEMKMVNDKATAYVCDNFACQQPISDYETLQQIIQ